MMGDLFIKILLGTLASISVYALTSWYINKKKEREFEREFETVFEKRYGSNWRDR